MGGDDDEGLSPFAKSIRAAAPWVSAVWQFTGSAMVGVAIGYGADKLFRSEPFGLLIGGLGGTGVGLYAFLRTTMRLTEKK